MISPASSLRSITFSFGILLAACLPACSDDSSSKGNGDVKDGPDSGGENDSAAPPAELAPALPTAQEACPEMVEGDNQFLGNNVLLHLPAAGAPEDGPLIFYWHGTGSGTFECGLTLGGQLEDIAAKGGVIACMDGGQNPTGGDYTGPFEWHDQDYVTADEVTACVTEKFKTSPRRIHALGMSAGGLQASQMALRRSYIASAVSLSGGCAACPEPPDPENKIPMMFFHGSWEADIVGIHFYDTSRFMENLLLERGQFAIDCNHNQGHIVPPEGASMWQFFQDHPYRVETEPYADGLPQGFTDYCQIVSEPWETPTGGPAAPDAGG